MNISEPQSHLSKDIRGYRPSVSCIETEDGTWIVEDSMGNYMAGNFTEEQALARAKQYIKEHRFIFNEDTEIKIRRQG